MKRFLVGSAFLSAVCSVAVLATPGTAQACGGFFCDGGPQPMPVDQTGEDILFVSDGNQVEVHIRVEYEGDPESFAWVIPVQSVPTDFTVGSQPLFDAIKAASVPTYAFTTQPDACGDFDPSPSANDGAVSAGAPGGGTGGADEGGPTIFATATVGAFEITVLGGGTADELVDWLNDNGYQQDDEALPIIEQYLEEDHKFAAIKLVGGAGIDELHPIALKFDGGEACVPLRLTRIAAMDDMDVRVYFLGDSRVVPSNYRHVLVNPLKIDWPGQASNYKEVITRAVDAMHADGRAFVTEYAGTSANVATDTLFQTQWDTSRFTAIDPASVADELVAQGLMVCGWDPFNGTEGCTGVNPLIDGLVEEFYLPTGVTFWDYYNNPTGYTIDLERWAGGVDFAAKLEERVLLPGQNARDLLEANPYLTRMYTTISPHEMTVDPVFYANPDLDEVLQSRSAQQRILCNNDAVWELPDGREVYIKNGDSWPDIGGEDYWEEEVDEMPSVGAPMVLVNNTEAINGLLRSHNDAQGWDGGTFPEPDGDAPGQTDLDASGCGCNSVGGNSAGAFAFTLLLGFGVVRRRR